MNGYFSKKPDFVGEDWATVPRGYTFASEPPPDLVSNQNLQNPNEWIRLLCIFQRAKLGVFKELYLLPDLIRQSEDFYVRLAGLRLLGGASSEPLLMSITAFYSHPDFDTRLAAYTASASSGNLNFVNPLLEVMLKKARGLEQDMISDELSKMLEPEPDVVCEPRSKEYKITVQKIMNKIQVGRKSSILFGKLLDLNYLIDRIEMLASSPDVQDYSGLLSDYVMLFESMTGTPSVGLFDDEINARVSRILATLNAFRQSGKLSLYQLGQRYFFGHVIPSHLTNVRRVERRVTHSNYSEAVI
jgi:hypothetical protein